MYPPPLGLFVERGCTFSFRSAPGWRRGIIASNSHPFLVLYAAFTFGRARKLREGFSPNALCQPGGTNARTAGTKGPRNGWLVPLEVCASRFEHGEMMHV